MYYKKSSIYLILLCLSIGISEGKPDIFAVDGIDADSIILQTIKRAELYCEYVDEYEAQVYVKGINEILKKNVLSSFIPELLIIDKKNDRNIMEAIAEVRYKAPNLFFQNIKAVSGTTRNVKEVQSRAMHFFNMNIYNPTSFNDEILMPLSEKAFKYYKFSLLSDKDSLDKKIITIKIEPKINSQKLIKGTISIISDLWIVSSVDISGEWQLSKFRLCADFGISDKEFLLPVETNLFISTKLLGNHIKEHYVSKIKYTAVKQYDDNSKRNKLGYDLTEYFKIKLDSLPIVKDSVFWNENRPVPLTESDKAIYDGNRKKSEKTATDSINFGKKEWELTKNIVSSKQFDFMESKFRYSGLLNPLKLAYSKLDGFVYWQQLKLHHSSISGKTIAFEPDVGFVFKRKEIFYKLPLNWLYQPQHMGTISLSLGNRNTAYNSKVIDKINEELKDSIINFDDLDLKYYKHHYLSLTNDYELLNGFVSNIGINYHLYKPVLPDIQLPVPSENLISDDYVSFTPVIGFTYTPRQYYRMIDRRKVYVGSNFPTFSAEYARGVPNILNGNSEYERVEADVLQLIPLGLIRSLRYYVGGGIFTNTKSIYFADFTKYSKRNFPRSWNDQMGGVFHLLDSKWYNASNSYAQVHLMYESPFMFLHFVKGIGKEILRERIYVGQLYLPALPSYTEIGYAVGNYIFSAGIFAGFEKTKCNGLGVKFNFEIGQ